MQPYFFIIIFLSINLRIRSSNASPHEAFIACSTSTYSCGTSIRNLSYPFWGSGRPIYCGRPEFQLFCAESFQSTGLLIGTTPYRVLEINPSNHTLTLAQQDFADTNTTCPLFPPNTALNDTLLSFRNQNDVVNLTLLYQCRNATHNHSLNRVSTSFNCSSNDDLGGCGVSVGVPVFSRGLERLKRGEETLMDVLKDGFRVGYMMNVTACAACEGSGGACGSSTAAEFVCYCPHGAFPYQCPAGKSEKTKIGIGVGTGLLGSTIIISALILIYIRRYKKHHSHTTILQHSRNVPSNSYSLSNLEKGDSHYLGVNLFSYDELQEATQYFSPSNKIGDGGFGIVYHGKLGDGREVAIKRLYEKRVQQFMNEIEILARLRHNNLVTLYGCTSSHSSELLLVYEYVINGTVADHLHGQKHSLNKPNTESSYLPWRTRLSVAVETANALVYLHASDIIHRDVKTTNILLDNNFSVKVADFGLSRLFLLDVTHVSTAPQGTPGYVDPEYHQCYQLTDKSDVYSFGVVLAELISSKPAVDITRHRHEINLSNLAVKKIQSDSLHELIDPILGFELDTRVKEEVTGVAELAFQCLQHDREMRPTMEEVLNVLAMIQERGDQSVEYAVDEAFRLKSDLSPLSSPGSKGKRESSSTPTSQSSC